MVALASCHGIATEPAPKGKALLQLSIPAAWSSRLYDLGSRWMHSWLRHCSEGCRAGKHPIQQDPSPSSLLSCAKEGTSLQAPGCWGGSMPHGHLSWVQHPGLHWECRWGEGQGDSSGGPAEAQGHKPGGPAQH